MQDTRNLDKPLHSFVSHRNIKYVHFSDKLKELPYFPYKSFNKPTDVTYETLTQDVKSFPTHRLYLIP